MKSWLTWSIKYCIREITKLFSCFKANQGKVALVPNKKAELHTCEY